MKNMSHQGYRKSEKKGGRQRVRFTVKFTDFYVKNVIITTIIIINFKSFLSIKKFPLSYKLCVEKH